MLWPAFVANINWPHGNMPSAQRHDSSVLGFFIGAGGKADCRTQEQQVCMTMPYNAATINIFPALRRHLSHGFTMVELVAVIVVVGILAAFAVPRFVQTETFDARTFADQNLNMLRYAQKLAIAQNRPVFAILNSNRVALCFNPACGTADRVLAPAGSNSGSAATTAQCGTDRSWLCEGRPNNVSYGVSATGIVLFFNALGRPFLNGDVDPASTFVRLSIPIGGGGPTRTVVVEAETGYVHL